MGDGLSIFEKLRWRQHDERVFMGSFDRLELDGQALRREPIEVRKATLASVLRSCRAGLQFNKHLEHSSLVMRVQDGPRRHCLEAAGVTLCLGPFT
jgi:hypothetical protein